MNLFQALVRYLSLILLINFCSQPVIATSKDDIYKLLTEGSCPSCNLKNADLSHADLRSTDLRGANLSGANLSNSILDNSNLELSDLRSAILYNASLKNVNLAGATLLDADFRNADLTNAIIDINELKYATWRNAQGIDMNLFSFDEVYKFALDEIEYKNYRQAEYFLELVIVKDNSNIPTLMALFNVQLIQGKMNESYQTIQKVKSYYEGKNDLESLDKINNIIMTMNSDLDKVSYGNGIGIDLLNAIGTLSNHLKLKPFSLP